MLKQCIADVISRVPVKLSDAVVLSDGNEEGNRLSTGFSFPRRACAVSSSSAELFHKTILLQLTRPVWCGR